MALPISNTFETGLADETALSVGNSDDGTAGTAFDSLGVTGAATLVFDTARAAHGTLSCRGTTGGVATCYVQWDTAMGTQTEVWGRIYVYRTAIPTPSRQYVVEPYNGATAAGLITWFTDGKMQVFDSTLSTVVTSTNNIPLNEWVRIEYHMLCNTSTGIFEAKMFHADDASPIETVTNSSANTLTQVDTMRLGHRNSSDIGASYWMDDLQVNATGYPGPAGAVATTAADDFPHRISGQGAGW